MIELWKPFRHEYYEVSNLGRARRVKPGINHPQIGHILKPNVGKKGYVTISTCYHGRHKTYSLHVLVARKFLGQCPRGKQVNHIDLNKENNRWDNFEYLTSKKNIHHAIEHGIKIGARLGDQRNAKLTAKEVRQIRKLHATGKYHKKSKTLAKRFAITPDSIYRIITNRRWKKAA